MIARYNAAKADALTRGADIEVTNFENELLKARAVINRPMSELNQLSGNDFEVYVTYYYLSEGMRLQRGTEIDSQRQAADSIFFTGYAKEIRFAALSLDSDGVSNFGDSSWVLREDMIAHRASLFEENTTRYYLKNDIKGTGDLDSRKGFRATWNDRIKLCVAKIASKIIRSTIVDEYPQLLIKEATDPMDDDYVEVHIFGPLTVRTIEEVTFKAIPTKISKKESKIRLAQIEGIKEKLRKYGVKVS